MYEPSAGSIALDRHDLSEFGVEAWRKRIAAIFQDFGRYELPAGQTVGIGDLPRLDDHQAVMEALTKTGSRDVIEELAEGLRTLLGKSFEGGRDLSGGQWQKLALARGRMRQDPLLLILDEPTASLDAQTEHAVFEQYVSAAHEAAQTFGTITVLISHRFSTVRMADLIVVLDDGSVREAGSHAELLQAGGLYAELFSLQQRSYQ
jgi:ATP-binding cassette subfamily B protein